uniref:Uncharacterized protein n=2 Tax=Clastoptera arizonana TaxID=38151 RepID=A0A1B6C0L0_9HEMI
MAPLFMLKQGGVLSYMNDPSMKLVYTSEEPSICVLFDVRTELHSVWKLRKATQEECQLMCVDNSLYSTNNQSSVFFNNLSQNSSVSKKGSIVNRSSLPNTGSSTNFSTPYSPISPMFSRTQSPLIGAYRNHSPSFKHSQSSPMCWSSRKAQFNKALGSPSTPPIDSRLGTSQILSEIVDEPRPIVPELCLEHIWTEKPTAPSFKNGEPAQATKIFQISDVLGQPYLCYLLKSKNQLMCTRLGKTNDIASEILVGYVSSISAKDAAPLQTLHMVAVLEVSGGVCLYTGTTPVGKVLVAGISSALASSIYLSSITTSFIQNSPFPRRSSLLSSTKMGDAMFDERVHLLSPVPSISYLSDHPDYNLASSKDTHVQSLRDPVGNRITLEFLNGSMFRFAFPEICSSPLVKECLRVLKIVLPKDMATLLVVKWYAARNAPGSQDISPQLEWELFKSVLLGLLGYDVDKLPEQLGVTINSPETPMQAKKKKCANNGCNEDWASLINSKYHEDKNEEIMMLLSLDSISLKENMSTIKSPEKIIPKGHINCTFPLFQYFQTILFSLHLLYEEMKLNLLYFESIPMLGILLQHLCRDLKLKEYVLHYWKDYPLICKLYKVSSQIEEEDLKNIFSRNNIPTCPPNIFQHISSLLQRHPVQPYPYISQVNVRSKDILQLVGLLCSGMENLDEIVLTVVPLGTKPNVCNTVKTTSKDADKYSKYTNIQKCVLLLHEKGYTRKDISTLPSGLALIIGDAIHRVREAPPADWAESVYRLIERQDLDATPIPPPPFIKEKGLTNTPLPTTNRSNQDGSEDGMECMDRYALKLRFNKDQRVSDVRRLLQSSRPVTIAIQQRPEVSDHEFIEEQEKHLYAICTRTMALPLGRGMFTLHSVCPLSSEPLSIPTLCISGKAPPRGTTVELSHIEIVPNMTMWPLFHNGVAAGLRIIPGATNIDSTWIVFNKPKIQPGQTVDLLPEHAGFLMALGLNGHLKNLAQLNTYGYLTRCHEMTSVGLLLGIAATKRGTMDAQTTKILSIHIESLLPPTSIELDIVQNIQIAALLSMGLVYQGTGHRHIAEVLLSEMGRPPGPEMENSVDRESYALAAGLGLGLVVLGRGSDMSGLMDLGIADILHFYMVGGHKRPLTGSQKEKYKSPSYQIREGDCVNNDVTSPGATLALGLMYFKTGNKAVANWMKAPDTQYLLDFVCPDYLLLRMIARGLILWDHILPTVEWVEEHVPAAIRPYCLVKPHPGNLPEHIDVETMNQAYCNLLAGACMAMGLRFAGSCNEEAFKTLHHFCKMFTSISGKSIAELAGKSTIETCINVILLSLAMVMAGSGNLEVLRICRFLNSRVGQASNSVVSYGSHLATHMALGLLFLGGGRYSLSTTPESVAAMLCAFYPKFPTHSNDNRYHLQAFRHLYVLASESRLLLPRDIDSGSLCFANITILYLDTIHYKNQSARLRAPCILPELKYLKEVHIEDDRYWTVVFRRDQNWSQLEKFLPKSIKVKQHAGCLSYVEDPQGFRSLLAQTLSTETSVPWTVPIKSIFAFSSDPSTVNFAHYFLETGEKKSVCNNNAELELTQFLTKLVYDCVTHDKLSIIPIWINLIKAIQNLEHIPSGISTWQLKLLIAHGASPCDTLPLPLVSPELSLSIENKISLILDSWQSPELSEVLRRYFFEEEFEVKDDISCKLATYLIFYDFPPAHVFFNSGDLNALTMHSILHKYNLPFSTSQKIVSILQNKF